MKNYSVTGLTRAKQLRKTSPDAELCLWRLLRNRNLQHFKFRRQHPIGKYIVDFVCIEKRLIIELDGGQHAEAVKYDAARTHMLEKAGFRVMRFWNNDVLTRPDAVLQKTYEELGCPSP